MSFRECCHVKSDGLKCKSPALNRHSYCYFHHRWNKRQQRRIQLGGPVGLNNNTGIEMPILESYEEIQIGIMEVLQAIIDDRISTKRAGLMLYALQLASTNTRLMASPGISQPKGVTELPEESPSPAAPHLPQSADASPEPPSIQLERARLQPRRNDQVMTGALAPEVTTPALDPSNPQRTTTPAATHPPQSADVGTTAPPRTPSDSVLKGHAFRRAVSGQENPGALASEVDALRRRYPGVPEESLARFLPSPNDDDTRLYYKPTDSYNWIQKIRERRNLLGITF